MTNDNLHLISGERYITSYGDKTEHLVGWRVMISADKQSPFQKDDNGPKAMLYFIIEDNDFEPFRDAWMTFDLNAFVLGAFGETKRNMLASQIDAIFFLELFFDNREALMTQWKEQVRVKREKTIKDLEQQLETHKKHLARVDKYAVMDPLETTTDALATISKDTANRINNYDKWRADLKPDTQRYADYTSSIESGLAFKTRIEDLSNKISDQAQQDYENAHSI